MNLISFDKLLEITEVFGPFGIGLSNNPYELVVEFSGSRMVNAPIFNLILEPDYIPVTYEILREDDTKGYIYLIKPRYLPE